MHTKTLKQGAVVSQEKFNSNKRPIYETISTITKFRDIFRIFRIPADTDKVFSLVK